MFTLNQHERFLPQPHGSKKVTILKVVGTLKPRDAQSVTFPVLKRELEKVRRELRNLMTGQYENKREKRGGRNDSRREDH